MLLEGEREGVGLAEELRVSEASTGGGVHQKWCGGRGG